jgi:hypothetical protein
MWENTEGVRVGVSVKKILNDKKQIPNKSQ